jgi:hypothetical protein
MPDSGHLVGSRYIDAGFSGGEDQKETKKKIGTHLMNMLLCDTALVLVQCVTYVHRIDLQQNSIFKETAPTSSGRDNERESLPTQLAGEGQRIRVTYRMETLDQRDACRTPLCVMIEDPRRKNMHRLSAFAALIIYTRLPTLDFGVLFQRTQSVASNFKDGQYAVVLRLSRTDDLYTADLTLS